MEMIQEMIRPELLVLIPVLYFIGMGLKKSATFANRYIPLLLGLTGMVLALLYLAATQPVENSQEIAALLFGGITQGVLCAGCSVYVNQLIKQHGKGDAA